MIEVVDLTPDGICIRVGGGAERIGNWDDDRQQSLTGFDGDDLPGPDRADVANIPTASTTGISPAQVVD